MRTTARVLRAKAVDMQKVYAIRRTDGAWYAGPSSISGMVPPWTAFERDATATSNLRNARAMLRKVRDTLKRETLMDAEIVQGVHDYGGFQRTHERKARD